MDYYNAADFGRDRLDQLHAEAREWNLARRIQAAERAAAAERDRTPRPIRPGGSWTDGLRYSVGILSAAAAVFFFTIR